MARSEQEPEPVRKATGRGQVKPFFFSTTLICEQGGDEGATFIAHCMVKARSAVEARRALIGWISDNANQPKFPEGCSEAEREHIDTQWNRYRIVTVREEMETSGTPQGLPIFWWGWDRLTSAAVE